MARRRSVKPSPSSLLAIAAQRIELPALPVRISYDAEADTLYLKFREDLQPNRTTDDLENGVIFDYHNRTLVGVELLAASQHV